MGTPGNQTAQYFLADPQEPQPISVEVPSPYREGRIVLADFCADLPGTRGKISAHFATSGLGESLGDVLVLRGAGRQFKERIDADPDLRRLLPEGHPGSHSFALRPLRPLPPDGCPRVQYRAPER